MGKGSVPRPFSVSNQEYQNRWDAIFGRDNEKKNEAQDVESDRPDPTRSGGGSNHSSADSGQAQIS